MTSSASAARDYIPRSKIPYLTRDCCQRSAVGPEDTLCLEEKAKCGNSCEVIELLLPEEKVSKGLYTLSLPRGKRRGCSMHAALFLLAKMVRVPPRIKPMLWCHSVGCELRSMRAWSTRCVCCCASRSREGYIMARFRAITQKRNMTCRKGVVVGNLLRYV